MFPRLYHVSTDSFSLLLGWAREQQLFVSWNWKHVAEEKAGSDCAVYCQYRMKTNCRGKHDCGITECRICHGNRKQSFFFFTSTSFFSSWENYLHFLYPWRALCHWICFSLSFQSFIQDKKKCWTGLYLSSEALTGIISCSKLHRHDKKVIMPRQESNVVWKIL